MASLISSIFQPSSIQYRNFMTSITVTSSEISSNAPKPPETPKDDFGIRKVTRVSDFHKKVLVFARRYKTVEEIPDLVPVELLEKARSRARIRLSNYLMIATGIGCLCYALSGRRAAERGESVAKMNREWHKEYVDRLKAQEESAGKVSK